MAKKDQVSKVTGEAAKAAKPGKDVKTEAAKGKAPARIRKTGTAQKKAARSKPETTFRLEAPEAAQVFVAGCFNEWDTTANPLERRNDGPWSCAVAIEPGQHQYRFVVDGAWCDDPANMARCWNEFGTENCLLNLSDHGTTVILDGSES
jgi:1,4-alpha-glucan branching enzyme